jgi:hypothetical protein
MSAHTHRQLEDAEGCRADDPVWCEAHALSSGAQPSSLRQQLILSKQGNLRSRAAATAGTLGNERLELGAVLLMHSMQGQSGGACYCSTRTAHLSSKEVKVQQGRYLAVCPPAHALWCCCCREQQKLQQQ